MEIQTPRAHPTADSKFEPSHVSVRAKVSGLWAAMLFVFAYVDIFSLYRPDFRADIEAGRISEFAIGQSFLLATTIYVVLPSLMVFATLVMRPGVSRLANMGLSVVYALTILGGAIGEWNYYLFGSAVEVGLLALIFYYARTWPRATET